MYSGVFSTVSPTDTNRPFAGASSVPEPPWQLDVATGSIAVTVTR
jgi:hypothetical protein